MRHVVRLRFLSPAFFDFFLDFFFDVAFFWPSFLRFDFDDFLDLSAFLAFLACLALYFLYVALETLTRLSLSRFSDARQPSGLGVAGGAVEDELHLDAALAGAEQQAGRGPGVHHVHRHLDPGAAS